MSDEDPEWEQVIAGGLTMEEGFDLVWLLIECYRQLRSPRSRWQSSYGESKFEWLKSDMPTLDHTSPLTIQDDWKISFCIRPPIVILTTVQNHSSVGSICTELKPVTLISLPEGRSDAYEPGQPRC